MSQPCPSPPRVPTLLVRAFVPSTRAELILGDLSEEFVETCVARGHRVARRQYLSSAVRSIIDAGAWHDWREPHRRRSPGGGATVFELKQAVRSLLRRPAYTMVVVSTLAVAASAVIAGVTMVDNVLLRPLPYAEPDELYTLWKADEARRSVPAFADSWNRIGVSLAEFQRLAERRDIFTSAAAYRTERVIVSGGAEPEEVVVARATPSLLEVLGTSPVWGVWFDGSEPEAAVLSYSYWSEAHAKDPGIIGRTLRVHDRLHVIVGVLPREFGIQPLSPFMQQGQPAVWVLAGYDADESAHDFEFIARIASGADAAQAAGMAAFSLGGDGSATSQQVVLEPRHASEVAAVRGPLLIMLAAVALFLALACANVVSLTLAEGAGRRQELSTRVALGATRMRIMRQLALESLLIGATGAALGALFAFPLRDLLVGMAPFTLPAADMQLDARSFVSIIVVAIIVSIMIGVAPAWILGRDTMRGPGNASAAHSTLAGGLLAVQFGLATVLLASAALLARSLAAESRVAPGFATENRLVVQVRRPAVVDPGFRERIHAALSAVPGVDGVAVTGRVPLLDGAGRWQVVAQGASGPGEAVFVTLEAVGGAYFDILQIPLIEGRGIDERDVAGQPKVAVVSETLARKLWPGQSAVGRTITDPFNTFAVVGVSADVRDMGLDAETEGVFYPAMAQATLPGGTSFLLRTAGDPSRFVAAVRGAVREAAPGAAIRHVLPFDRIVADALAADRYRATLALMIAAAALLIAGIGLAGLVIRNVARRLREFAIRIALGATPLTVMLLSLHRVVISVMAGALLGTLGAVAAGRALAGYLFGVGTTDHASLLFTLALLAVMVVATLGAALRRIATTDLLQYLGREV